MWRTKNACSEYLLFHWIVIFLQNKISWNEHTKTFHGIFLCDGMHKFYYQICFFYIIGYFLFQFKHIYIFYVRTFLSALGCLRGKQRIHENKNIYELYTIFNVIKYKWCDWLKQYFIKWFQKFLLKNALFDYFGQV